METTDLWAAYADLLAVAGRGQFGVPPPGEWTAEQLLAHIVATDTASPPSP